MGLEIADYIDELISANPTVADPVSQGDDHIRLVKQVLKNALPGNTAPLTFTGNMNLTGDYNGTNATMTGAVQGGTVTDGTYDLGTIGITVSRIDAYGLITSATTVDGVNIIGVTNNPGNGDFTVNFANSAAAKDKQVTLVNMHTTPQLGDGAIVASCGHQSVNQMNIKASILINGNPAIATANNAYPIDIFRMFIP